MSVFAKYETKNYPYRFAGTMTVGMIAGGTPTDPEVARRWLKTKLAANDDLIREAVAEMMAERGLDVDAALDAVVTDQHLNGFKRDEIGLYIEGRQLKACLKEGACVAASVGNLPQKNWGMTSKWISAFAAEHIFVVEDRLYLGVATASGVNQRFVHTWKNKSAIQYEEYVQEAKIAFTVESDHDFPEEQWAAIWLTCERQGLGASRSQGFGRFTVTGWERLSA